MSSSAAFICLFVLLACMTTANAGCQRGFTRYGNACRKFVVCKSATDYCHWTEAMNVCRKVLDNTATNEVLSDAVDKECLANAFEKEEYYMEGKVQGSNCFINNIEKGVYTYYVKKVGRERKTHEGYICNASL